MVEQLNTWVRNPRQCVLEKIREVVVLCFLDFLDIIFSIGHGYEEHMFVWGVKLGILTTYFDL